MADIAELAIRVDSLEAKLASKELDGLGRSARNAGTAAERSERQLERMQRTVTRLVGAFAGFAAVSRVLSSSIVQAREFGATVSEVGTLLRDRSTLDGMTQSVRALSREYGSAPTAQAKALYQAISAGAKEGAESVNLLEVANRTAIGGITDVTTAVDILTTATNAYAASNLQAGDAADILFIGMRGGKTTVGELASALGRVIPTATAAGVEFETIVAATAALTTQGQSTNMAVTGLTAALSQIISPASQARELASELGIEFNLAGLNAMGFAGFMEHVIDKTDGSKEAISTLFGSIEAGRAVFSLAGQGGVKLAEILGDMENRAGAADKAFREMSKTADFALKQLTESLRSELIDIGEGILESIAPAARVLADNMQEISAAVSAVAKVIGVVLVGQAGGALMKWLQDSTLRMADHARSATTAAAADALWAQNKLAGARAAVVSAQAQVADNAATMAAIELSRQQALGELSVANQQIMAAQRTIAATKATMHLSGSRHAAMLANEQLVASEMRRNAALTQLSVLGQQTVRVQAQMAASASALTAANSGLAAASVTAAGALRGASVAAAAYAFAMRGLSSILALIGGPLGLLVIGLGALTLAIMKANAETKERLENERAGILSLKEMNDEMERAIERRRLLNEAEKAGRSAEQQSAIEAVTGAMRELAEVEQQIIELRSQWGSAIEYQALQARMEELRETVSMASTEWERHGRLLVEQHGPAQALVMAFEKITGSQLPEWLQNLVPSLRQAKEEITATADASTDGVDKMADFSKAIAQQIIDLQAQRIEFEQGKEAALLFMAVQETGVEGIEGLSTALRAQISELVKLDAALEKSKTKKEQDEARVKAMQAAMSANAKAAADYRRSMATLAAQLGGPLAVAQLEFNTALDDMQEHLFEGIITMEEADAAYAIFVAQLEKAKKEIEENSDEARELEAILSRFDNIGMSAIVRELDLVREALLEATDPAIVARLQTAFGHLRHEMVTNMVGAAQAGLSSMQSMAKEGSKAYKAMEVAQQALNVVMAISAVLNQGKGDPYTAFARMAAMAAAVAGLVGSIGSFGGGFSNTAAERQATQGTGTVLGDAEAQSESIARGIDITAEATSALVGINRGMLRSLQSLEAGLTGASGMLARGAGSVDFSAMPDTSFGPGGLLGGLLGGISGAGLIGGLFGGGIVGALLGRLLGGSSEITDQGIVIMGGALSQMIEDIAVGAYQEVQYRRWRFGSRRTREEITDVSDELQTQFQLIIESITNTVREGALALGLLPDEIEAALESFRVEEIRISTMDLSAEEQQAALAAVFSSIFDGLAGHVVDWLPQFQRVGEGLGETLVRVATGVQVTQEAVLRLGFALDETDPERFAQISEGLIELMGGIDEFIAGMTSFMSAFAPDEHIFAVAQDDLNRAFAQFNLTVPETREGMWELMQTLDATTEEGREQIAMLLRITDAANTYYTMLEEQERDRIRAAEAQADALADYLGQVQALRDELSDPLLSDFQREWREIGRWAADTAEQLNATARAAGMQAAAEEDLALVHEVAAQRAAAAIRRLQDAARSLVDRLYGTDLEQLDAQIEAMGGSTQTQLDGINAVGQAADDMYRRQLAAIQNIQRWLDDQLLDPTLSSLTPQERLAEARRQLEALAAAARSGDVDALEQLPGAANAFLTELRDFWASGEQFTIGEAWVRELMGEFAGMSPTGSPGGGIGGGAVATVSPELSALYEERERLLAQIEADQRRLMAEELAGYMRDLLAATGDSLTDVAASIRVSVSDLVTDLGVIVGESTIENVMALTEVARMLGVDLAELATQVGIELGTLAERQSLLNQALDETLAAIPDEFRDRLADPLEALRNATTEADANDALFDLMAITDELPAGIRDMLAPFFDWLDPSPVLTELGTLRTIEDIVSQQLAVISTSESRLGMIESITVDQLSKMGSIDAATHQSMFILETILENIRAQNRADNLPHYETGTSYVPRTGPAVLHEGEMVLPAAIADIVRGSSGGGGGDMRGVETRLDRIAEITERRMQRVEDRLERIEQAERNTGEQIDRASRRNHDAGLAVRG